MSDLPCAPTGKRWIGRASDVSKVESRLPFALTMASTPHRSLAAAGARMEGAFSLGVVERI